MNPFEQPRQNLEYPLSFELRVIHDAEAADAVRAGLAALLETLGMAGGPLKVLPSPKPRFGRLSAPVKVVDAPGMEALYRGVSVIPGVRYVL